SRAESCEEGRCASRIVDGQGWQSPVRVKAAQNRTVGRAQSGVLALDRHPHPYGRGSDSLPGFLNGPESCGARPESWTARGGSPLRAARTAHPPGLGLGRGQPSVAVPWGLRGFVTQNGRRIRSMLLVISQL